MSWELESKGKKHREPYGAQDGTPPGPLFLTSSHLPLYIIRGVQERRWTLDSSTVPTQESEQYTAAQPAKIPLSKGERFNTLYIYPSHYKHLRILNIYDSANVIYPMSGTLLTKIMTTITNANWSLQSDEG